MNKSANFISSVLFFLLAGSCEKKDIGIVDISLVNTQTYTYDLNLCGDEEGASIITQAEHYELSEIVRDSTTQFCVMFKYKPITGFIGSDYVKVEINSGSDGASAGNTDYLEFNITVTN